MFPVPPPSIPHTWAGLSVPKGIMEPDDPDIESVFWWLTTQHLPDLGNPIFIRLISYFTEPDSAAHKVP